MRPHARSLAAAVAALFALWLPVGGQQAVQYLVFAEPDVVDDVCSRHGLKPIATIDGHGVCLAEAGAGVDSEELNEAVEEDEDILEFEENRDVLVSESQPSLDLSTAAILETLPDRTPVEFHGASAWSGYVNQAARALIRHQDPPGYPLTRPAVVAIIDTGVDAFHPLLAGSVLPGFDFTRDTAGIASDMMDLDLSTAAILEGSPEPADHVVLVNQATAAFLELSTAAILETHPPLPAAFGHGTMVAGLVHLVAPTASIMPLKVFRADGGSRLFDIVRAVYYAADQGADVISMSFSLAARSKVLERALSHAGDLEIVLVASAGNQGSDEQHYPAALSKVVGVASTTTADIRSTFSNYGDNLVTVAAPGEALITTFPGGHYAAAWGTSFSTGLVSGAAALVHQVEPGPAREEVVSSLRRADDVGQELGEGRLNLLNAMSHRTK